MKLNLPFAVVLSTTTTMVNASLWSLFSVSSGDKKNVVKKMNEEPGLRGRNKEDVNASNNKTDIVKCPGPEDGRIKLQGGTVHHISKSPQGCYCKLGLMKSYLEKENNELIIPVAQSYGGLEWEEDDSVSSSTTKVDFSIRCFEDTSWCEIELPSPATGLSFTLVGSQYQEEFDQDNYEEGYRIFQDMQAEEEEVQGVAFLESLLEQTLEEKEQRKLLVQRELPRCNIMLGGSCSRNHYCCQGSCQSGTCQLSATVPTSSPVSVPAGPQSCPGPNQPCHSKNDLCCVGLCPNGRNAVCPAAPSPASTPMTSSPTAGPTGSPVTPTKSTVTDTLTSKPVTNESTSSPVMDVPTSSPPTDTPPSSPLTDEPTSSPVTGTLTVSPITEAPAASPTDSPPTTAPLDLLRSSSGQVLLLVDTVSGKHAGRSYDGNDWHSVYPLLEEFVCDATKCTVPSPKYLYSIVSHIAPTMTAQEKTSRLLMQTTFGPDLGLIVSTQSLTAEEWIAQQMETTPTLHRAHLRQHANQPLRQESDFFGTRDPCDAGSRWNRYAFSKLDRKKTLKVSGAGPYVLSIDDIHRAEVATDPGIPVDNTICEIEEYVGGAIHIGPLHTTDMTSDCRETVTDMNGVTVPNPEAVFLTNPAIELSTFSGPTGAIFSELTTPVVGTKILATPPTTCSIGPIFPVFMKEAGSNNIYIHSRRAETVDNNLGSMNQNRSPRTRTCPSAPKSFLNEDMCIVRSGCSPPTYSSATFALNDDNIRKFYEKQGIFAYKIENLKIFDADRPVKSPCDASQAFHRFVRREDENMDLTCVSETSLDSVLKSNLTAAIQVAMTTSTGKIVVDVPSASYSCDDTSTSAVGASISITGAGCFSHTHPEEWSVFDFSRWIMIHPGNQDAFAGHRPNPIAKNAESLEKSGPAAEQIKAATTIVYPGWKPQVRFEDNYAKHLVKLGNYMDEIDFATLDPRLQGPSIATELGSRVIGEVDQVMEICGSPGEVANDPYAGHQYDNFRDGDQGRVDPDIYDQSHYRNPSKQILWSTVARMASDQLRQRVAWALAQIFVVTQNDIGRDNEIEAWASYYDIFVRNAFGTFRQILKEVAYHPMMGNMLTYIDCRAYFRQIEDGKMLFPDENFAREIMQLFTIGLYKLNQDGTPIIGTNNVTLATYDNGDIMETSRGWTGLVEPDSRSNYEASSLDDYASNRVDPLEFRSQELRDVYPKLWLDDNGRKYIGDGLPMCKSLPKQAFLKAGATYHYLGISGFSRLGRYEDDEVHDPDKLLVLDSQNSALYSALCNANGGSCQFKSTVLLAADLPCSGSCTPSQTAHVAGAFCECTIDEPRVVRLDGANTGSSVPVYYEYVKPPCVRLGFPENGQAKTIKERGVDDWAVCADVSLVEAGATCCEAENDLTWAKTVCTFQEERVSYAKAAEYCSAAGMFMCPWRSNSFNGACSNNGDYNRVHWRSGLMYMWTNSTCKVQAQISQDGDVAIIHNVEPLASAVKIRVAEGKGTYFRVIWEGDKSFPKVGNGCGTGCSVSTIDPLTCLCDTQVDTVAAFSAFPTLAQLESELRVGAPNPEMLAGYHDGLFHAEGYIYYFASSNALDIDTIFEVGGKFFLNIKSTVTVGDGKSFRNPPMMGSPHDETRRDAYYEVDQMLDHYVGHSNAPPFIAGRLIQLLTSSNPSPGYVKAVADAFASGYFPPAPCNKFGGGSYGDMAAAIAAVFLHEEARNEVLDVDPTHGRLREPVVQFLHYIRAMNLDTSDGREREVRLGNLWRIGQEPHNAPSVFSYFMPDFAPPGPVFASGLHSPESQLLDSPRIVATLNAMVSLSPYGLNDCLDGVGDSLERKEVEDQPSSNSIGCSKLNDVPYTQSGDVPFRFRFRPATWDSDTLPFSSSDPEVFRNEAEKVADELALLLTPGKLDPASRAILVEAYMSAAVNEKNADDAHAMGLRTMQQLFQIIPEFHITNQLRDPSTSVQVRPVENLTMPVNPPPISGYKSFVYFYMSGGADSYSLLVPKSGCNSNLTKQYLTVRGDVALDLSKTHTIQANNPAQPCKAFGLHPSLSNIASMYNAGFVAAIANIGPLAERLNKTEYNDKTKDVPRSLFAHNTQTVITQTVAPLDSTANGILGRIGDALNDQTCESDPDPDSCKGFAAYSIQGSPKILEGAPGVSRVADILTEDGVTALNSDGTNLQADIKKLNELKATSIFGETRGAAVMNALQRLELLDGALGGASTVASCWDAFPSSSLKDQFRTVAKIIFKRDALEASTDVFYVTQGGYDTHSDNGPKLTQLFGGVDDAIGCFYTEMVAQGLWNNVTIMTASEFGRTLTSNGLGTDHGWGGNHLIMGGEIAGNKVYGEYPVDITDSGPFRLFRGRLIPTSSWDSVWNSCAQWLGLTPTRIASILPNLPNFPNDGMGTALYQSL